MSRATRVRARPASYPAYSAPGASTTNSPSPMGRSDARCRNLTGPLEGVAKQTLSDGGIGAPRLGYPLVVDAEQFTLGDARRQRIFHRTQRRLRDRRRDVQAGDLVGRLGPSRTRHHGAASTRSALVTSCGIIAANIGVKPSVPTRRASRKPGIFAKSAARLAGFQLEAIQIVAADLRRHSLVPGREQMHAPGFPHHHRNRREGKHTGSTELTRARHVSHVADATEHQRVEIVAFHAGEDLCAPFGTQAGEVDPGIVLEAHHADEHPAVTGDGAHASTHRGRPYGSYVEPLSLTHPVSVTATMSSDGSPRNRPPR